MKKQIKNIMTFLCMATLMFVMQDAAAQNDAMQKDMKMKGDKMKIKMKMDESDLKTWPKEAQMAVKEQMGKYGNPNEVTPTMMIWYNNGVFAKTIITKMVSKHDFPKMHVDMMEQSIMHKVPLDLVDELANFDGSVTYDRTQGLLAARCDKEENNLLALNLAHDIITGKKTVAEARQAYGEMISQAMKGVKNEYMMKLMFTTEMNSPDSDVETIKM